MNKKEKAVRDLKIELEAVRAKIDAECSRGYGTNLEILKDLQEIEDSIEIELAELEQT